VAWILRGNKKQSRLALAVGSTILLLSLLFGWVRLSSNPGRKTISAGLTVVAENLHQTATKTPVLTVTQNYIDRITALAKCGAACVIFPEKALLVKVGAKDTVLQLLQKASTENNVTIIGGLLAYKEQSRQNIVEYISPVRTSQEYVKRFHVKGFEDGDEVGQNVGWLQNAEIPSAMAICKDMDFPQWLRLYSEANLLFVPAWDFEKDGWLHSRMAVLRGVENGFTIVRAARQGRLTVSDYCGRIVGEEVSDHGNAGSLLVQVPVYSINTLYSRWGDWIGWACTITVLGFGGAGFLRKKT
jgi:apolipoprotein N-acyltransferase